MIAAEVRIEDGEFICHAGVIGSPRTAWHNTCTRPCIHMLADLPAALLFSREPILRVGFQPIVYTRHNWPSIVRRNEDIVTLAFDRIGDVARCHHNPKAPLKAAATYQYRLMPMRWSDGNEFHDDDNVLLGVWPD